MSEFLLDRALILEAFRRMEVALRRRCLRCRVYVYGGAAIALGFDESRSSHDVDGQYGGASAVEEVIALVGDELGLPRGWMNEQASVYLPREEDLDEVPVFVGKFLSVTRASARHLLGMKVDALRARDLDDIRLLCDDLGITSVEDALRVRDSLFPDEPAISPGKLERLRSVLPDEPTHDVPDPGAGFTG